MCTRGRSLQQAVLAPSGELLALHVSDGGGPRVIVVPIGAGPERIVVADPRPGAFAWTPDSAGLVFTSGATLCQVPVSGGPGRVVVEAEGRVSAPAMSPDGHAAAYVVDDRHVEVAPLAGGPPTRLTAAAAFAFDPAWSPDSTTVAWHEWDVPDMPWDGGRIVTRRADGSAPAATVAGGPGVSVQQPRFSPDGRLGYLCDATGWLTVWVEGEPVVDERFEHGDPAWGQGQRSWCWSPIGRAIAFNRNEGGFGRLVVVDLATREATDLGRAVHRSLSWAGDAIAAVRTGAKTPTQAVVYRDGARTTLAHGPVAGFEPALVEPRPVEWGDGVHGLLYEPQEPVGLIVQIHGGPVGQNQVIFDAKTAYWLDRGWTVFVPDFRGSTGHGRAYQQAVNGRLGELDVDDVADGIRALGADPQRTVLMGGSSGGMTALLLAARHPGLCAAAVMSYPVVDLVALAKSTHRFEAHANDRLVGTSKRVLRERSPLAHADGIDVPVLVFHGLADEVVPPSQSRALVRKLRARGVDVEHVEYEGEGHGFRQPANVEDQLVRTEAFLGEKVLGLPE
jgi:dipeptidyl aminopeptidase/acylaminoacyl peptidase